MKIFAIVVLLASTQVFAKNLNCQVEASGVEFTVQSLTETVNGVEKVERIRVTDNNATYSNVVFTGDSIFEETQGTEYVLNGARDVNQTLIAMKIPKMDLAASRVRVTMSAEIKDLKISIPLSAPITVMCDYTAE